MSAFAVFRSVPGGRADEIEAKAEVTARLSVVGGRPEHAWISAFQRSASKPAGQDSVSVFDDEDELRGPSVKGGFGSAAEVRQGPHERPLLGLKRT